MAYHDSGADGDSAATVRIWNNVTVTDRQKRDGNHPHGVENVRVSHVVITVPQHRALDTAHYHYYSYSQLLLIIQKFNCSE